MKLSFFALIFTPLVAFGTDEITFRGEDTKTSKECFLRVAKTYFAGNTKLWEDFRADASTDYGHGADVPGEVTLQTDKAQPKRLFGKNTSENELEVALDKGQEFKSASSYKLKWKHGDHFHRYYCAKLKDVTQP